MAIIICEICKIFLPYQVILSKTFSCQLIVVVMSLLSVVCFLNVDSMAADFEET